VQEILYYILIGAVPVLLAITLHEAAHGWVADKLGDPTARKLGRITLNPIKHIDPQGTIFIPLC
jgi:Zn-dependent protease